MPKIEQGKKGKANRLKAAPYSKPVKGGGALKDDMASRPDLLGLKPGLIKKMKKKQAFLKNIGVMDASGQLVREKKKGPLGDVHLLLDSLTHEPDDGKTPGAAQRDKGSKDKSKGAAFSTIRSNNAKKLVAPAELTRMQAVLKHPSFQANPIATIQEHLRNSIEARKQSEKIAIRKK